MKKIYLIRYIEDDNIEGFVECRGDFKTWLILHNRERKRVGEIEEFEDEFEIIEVWGLV